MSDDWNDNYVQGFMPWDTSEPDPVLVEYIDAHRLASGRALDMLEIVELRGTSFDLGTADPPHAWACASRLRTEPAQPSSRH